jgi:hypothetical protein
MVSFNWRLKSNQHHGCQRRGPFEGAAADEFDELGKFRILSMICYYQA